MLHQKLILCLTVVGALYADTAVGQIGKLPPPLGAIHGRKWRDDNGDGRRSSTEPGLPGVTV